MKLYKLLLQADAELDLANVKTADRWLREPRQHLLLTALSHHDLDAWPGWYPGDENVWRQNVRALRTLHHGLMSKRSGKTGMMPTQEAEAILSSYVSKLRVVVVRNDEIRCRSVESPRKGIRFIVDRLPYKPLTNKVPFKVSIIPGPCTRFPENTPLTQPMLASVGLDRFWQVAFWSLISDEDAHRVCEQCGSVLPSTRKTARPTKAPICRRCYWQKWRAKQPKKKLRDTWAEQKRQQRERDTSRPYRSLQQ